MNTNVLFAATLACWMLYLAIAEFRISRVTRQRNHWHDKYMTLADECGFEPIDEPMSCDAPPKDCK